MSDELLTRENRAKGELLRLYTGARPSHAVLICGGSAETRDSLAQYAAAVLMCCGKAEKPCGTCPACVKVQRGVHPDILLYDKPSDKKQYVKRDVSDMCAEVYNTPNEADKRVFILRELQNMTEESQNLLLKVIEEPPEYSAFILTAASANTVLATVLSRATRVSLGEGDGRDEKNSDAIPAAENIAQALTELSEFEVIKACAVLDGSRDLVSPVINELIILFRDAAVIKKGGESLSGTAAAQSLAGAFTVRQLIDAYDFLNLLLSGADRYQNKTLLISRLSAGLCGAVQ